MKLKELLVSCKFEDILSIIDQTYAGAAQYSTPLRKAYDILIEMQPIASKKSIRYKTLWNPESSEEFIGAEDSNFTTTWEVCLGKEIICEEGVELNDLEIAANCLVNLCMIGRYPHSFEKEHELLLKA